MRNLMIKAAAWQQSKSLKREEGQTVVEYALVVGLVSVVIIAALVLAGKTWITTIATNVTTAINA